MIIDVDATLRRLLYRSSFDPAQVDVSFDPPTREWFEKLGGRPTLNLYLYELLECAEQRQQGERRFELRYLVSAWAQLVEDEHYLLWHALEALVAHPELSPDVVEGALRELAAPLRTSIGRLEGARITALWAALENVQRPALSFSVTLPMTRAAQRFTGPAVQDLVTQVGRRVGPEE